MNNNEVVKVDSIIKLMEKLSEKEVKYLIAIGALTYLIKYSIDNNIGVSCHFSKGDMKLDFMTQSLCLGQS